MAGAPSDDDDLARAEIALSLANDLFKAEMLAADTIDLKALGLASLDVAGVAVVVTFHASISVWWLSTISLATAAVCLFLVLLQRRWELGTEPSTFWDEHEGGTRLTMLESALASTERNRLHNQPLVDFKGLWFRWGHRFTGVGLITLLVTTLNRNIH